MTCCDEPSCRRRQPLHLYRGLSGRWLVATRSAGGSAVEKHALPEDVQGQLTEMADAFAWLAAVEAAMGGRQQILDALGLQIQRKVEA
jgi:hypothetical protein